MPTKPTSSHVNRVYGLDILRCAAILFVVIGHSNVFLPAGAGRFLGHFMTDGVGLFFVLSGFLIGGMFIRAFDQTPMTPSGMLEFWKRRWYRTLPAYLLVLTIVTAVRWAESGRPGFRMVLHHFTFTQNLTQCPPYWFFPESWSLSVEEWFYLALPVGLLALTKLARVPFRQAALLFIGIVVLTVPSLRAWRFSQIPNAEPLYLDELFTKSVALRLDSIIFGVLGAYVSFYHPARWKRHRATLFIAGLAILAADANAGPIVGRAYILTIGFAVRAVATLMLLPFLSSVTHGAGIVYKAVTHISIISYSMYLVNYSLILRFLLIRLYPHQETDAAGWQRVAAYVSFWVLTLVLATVMYRCWEKPTTDLRNRSKRMKRDQPPLPERPTPPNEVIPVVKLG